MLIIIITTIIIQKIYKTYLSHCIPLICEESNHCPDLLDNFFLLSQWGHQTQLVLTLRSGKSPYASLFSVSCSLLLTCESRQARQQCQPSGSSVWCGRVWRGWAFFCKFVSVQKTEDDWWFLEVFATDTLCLLKIKVFSQRDRKLGNCLLNSIMFMHLRCEPI